MAENFFIEKIDSMPDWLVSFCKAISYELWPIDTVGQIGYRWLAPDSDINTSGIWVLGIYPCPTEISGGLLDGDLVNPGFGINLKNIIDQFQSLEDIRWICPSKFNSGLEGPRVQLEGTLMDSAANRLRLQIFAVAPSDEDASIIFDTITGKSRPK